jgi:hypothetical protein
MLENADDRPQRIPVPALPHRDFRALTVARLAIFAKVRQWSLLFEFFESRDFSTDHG